MLKPDYWLGEMPDTYNMQVIIKIFVPDSNNNFTNICIHYLCTLSECSYEIWTHTRKYRDTAVRLRQ